MRKKPFLILFGLVAVVVAVVVIATTPTYHYVRPVADCPNNGDGTTFACASSPGGVGAFAELPATPVGGDIYFKAGSASLYLPETINVDNITVYKAVDCTITAASWCAGTPSGNRPQNVAGWAASMGTLQAKWQDTWTDPEAHAGSNLKICGNHIIYDGSYGNTDPRSTIGGQGFQMLGQGGLGIGCGATASQTDVTVAHFEAGGSGLQPFYRASVNSCSYSGGVATIGTATDTGGVNGDKVGGWTSTNAVLFTNIHAATITSSSMTVPLPSSPCAGLVAVALDYIPGGGMGVSNNTETFTNITFNGVYTHGVGGGVSFRNCSTCTLEHSAITTNRSTPTYHSNAIAVSVATNSTTMGPLDILWNYMLDLNGTADICFLGNSSGNYGGQLTGAHIIGNLNGCSSGAPIDHCGSSGFFTDTQGEGVVTDSYLGNNTFFNKPTPQGYAVGMYLNCPGTGRCSSFPGSPSSTGSSENNLAYLVPSGAGSTNGVSFKAAGGKNSLFSVTQAYNSLVNSGILDSLWTSSTASPSFNVKITSGAADPFLNDAAGDYHPAAPFTAANNSGNQWAIGNCSLPAPFNAAPYNVDFYGVTFGSTTGCARGAVEYQPSGGSSNAQVAPTTMPFSPAQLVATASPSQTIVLTNTGGATLNIASVVESGSAAFGITNGCGATLATNASCNVIVVFTPNAAACCVNPYAGTVTFTDDSGGTPGQTQAVTLSGTGYAPITVRAGTSKSGTVN